MTRVLSNIGWVVMMLLAVLVAALASKYLWLSPQAAAPPPLLETVIDRHTIFLFHIAGGLIALVTGAWNFLERSRERFLNLHRWLGRVYLVSVLSSSIAGFSLSFTAQGGLTARIGFGMLAFLWLVTAVFAYIRIRAFDIESHRRWMIRNYALTFAAVTLRLWLPFFMITGYDFTSAYPTVAWLAWVPNLLVAELIASRLASAPRGTESQVG
jgi:uncharacterized membrane protein